MSQMTTSTHAAASNWFCLRTQPKHEHIAAAHLANIPKLEVYLPRIRFKRSTCDGPAWFTEALFPNYLFARFELAAQMRQVHHTRGIQRIVHFGDQWPSIPEAVIEELRARVPAGKVHVLREEFRPGDQALISGGPFHNLKAVVIRLMPARQRIAVLLDFLGRQTALELPRGALIAEKNVRIRATPPTPLGE